jgi:hypothetical protein
MGVLVGTAVSPITGGVGGSVAVFVGSGVHVAVLVLVGSGVTVFVGSGVIVAVSVGVTCASAGREAVTVPVTTPTGRVQVAVTSAADPPSAGFCNASPRLNSSIAAKNKRPAQPTPSGPCRRVICSSYILK